MPGLDLEGALERSVRLANLPAPHIDRAACIPGVGRALSRVELAPADACQFRRKLLLGVVQALLREIDESAQQVQTDGGQAPGSCAG